MALRYFYDSNRNEISLTKGEIDTLTLSDATGTLRMTHTINNGNYTISDGTHTVLSHNIENGTLGDSVLKSYVDNSVNPIENTLTVHSGLITDLQNTDNTQNTTLANHESRLTTVEGSSGVVADIATVLAVGDTDGSGVDAGGHGIYNLGDVGCQDLSCRAIQTTGDISSDYGINMNSNSMFGYDTDKSAYMFVVDAGSKSIYSSSGAGLFGFSNLDALQTLANTLNDKVTALETYNTNLKNLILSISRSISLLDANTGEAFDFSNLLD